MIELKENKSVKELIEELQAQRGYEENSLREKRAEIVQKQSKTKEVYQRLREERNQAILQEKNKLPAITVKHLTDREYFKKKSKNSIWFGVLVALIVGIFGSAALAATIKEIENPAGACFVLIGAVIVAMVIAVEAKKLPLKKRLSEINSDEKVIEFDKKYDQIFNEYYDKTADYNNSIGKLKEEEEQSVEYLTEIEQNLFALIYRNTLFFYGSNKSYSYQIYLDGRLYDEVKGKKIVEIKISEGIHSFKIETVSYNPVDRSIIDAYTFSTRQLIAEPHTAEAWAYVCDGLHIEQVTARRFEMETKVKLL